MPLPSQPGRLSSARSALALVFIGGCCPSNFFYLSLFTSLFPFLSASSDSHSSSNPLGPPLTGEYPKKMLNRGRTEPQSQAQRGQPWPLALPSAWAELRVLPSAPGPGVEQAQASSEAAPTVLEGTSPCDAQGADLRGFVQPEQVNLYFYIRGAAGPHPLEAKCLHTEEPALVISDVPGFLSVCFNN